MPINVKSINDDDLYSVRECAEILEVGEQTVRNHSKNETLTGTKAKNNRWKVKGIELKKFLVKNSPMS